MENRDEGQAPVPADVGRKLTPLETELMVAVRELLATHPAAYRHPHKIDNRTDNAVRIARAAYRRATGEA
jgi:hypothetical protein